MSSSERVRVIRSAKRTRTAQARMVSGVLEVRIPATFSEQQERDIVAEMLAKMQARHSSSVRSDAELYDRAVELNHSVLDGRAQFTAIRWCSRQTTRWGSCTTTTGQIRISDRLKEVPDYVLNSVIVHELVHTIVAGHTAGFWELANKAPQAERAKGYLEAYQRFGP